MVKVAGFCVSALILIAGAVAAQSTKPAAQWQGKRSSAPIGHAPAAPRPDIATGHNGQPCIPSPISANRVVANVAPANVKPHSAPASPDVYGVAKPIVIPDPAPDDPPMDPGVTEAVPPGSGPDGGPTASSSQPATSQAPTGVPSCPNHH